MLANGWVIKNVSFMLYHDHGRIEEGELPGIPDPD